MAPGPLDDLVQRAFGLDERVEALGARPTTPGDTFWTAHWAPFVSAADFPRRLSWDGWSTDELGWLSAPVPAAAPPWAERLRQWLALAEAQGTQVPGTAQPVPTPAQPRSANPFAEVYSPALALLAREVGDHPALAAALEKRLAAIGAPTLAPAWEAHAGPYATFIAQWTGPALRAQLARLPVLGRLWATALDQAIAAAREAFARLEADAELIAATFGPAYTGPLAQIEPNRSDPHHEGRTVWRFAFEAGGELYYKPRPMAPDAAWSAFVAWLEAAGLDPVLKAPRTLDRGAYGWAEGLKHAPLPAGADPAPFYRRMGALVAIAHALGADDLHAENVLAVGDHPVLVDLETLVPPSLTPTAPGDAFASPASLAHALDQGVLNSLLVTWATPRPGGVADLGALADPLDFGGLQAATWEDPGTDQMRPGFTELPPPRAHLAHQDGQPLRARDHLPAILAGFDATYAFLEAHRDALLASDGPLAGFAAAPVRLIFRQTRHYVLLQAASWAPERLADGRLRSFGFDRLARTFLRQPVAPPLWPLIGAERRALERLDLPYVAGNTGSRALSVDGLTIPDALPLAPFAVTHARLAALGPADHAFQRATLCWALGLNRADLLDEEAPTRLPPPSPVPGEGATSLSPRERVPGRAGEGPNGTPFDPLEAAHKLGTRLAQSALRTSDGAATWLARLPAEVEGAHATGLLGPNLWDGALGPALFLAALARATRDPAMTELARAAARPARTLAADPQTLLASATAEHVVPLAYGLARLAPLLDDPALTTEARGVLAALPVEALAQVADPDVLGGLAGVVAALLGLEAATGDPRAADLAHHAARLLRDRAEPFPGGGTGWKGAMGTFPAGYGHGQAGIAAVLLRAAARTGDDALARAADAAMDAEASRFVPAEGDWRVAWTGEPEGAPPSFMAGWCHGAPGMALSRLVARDRHPDRAAELETALAAMAKLEPHIYDFPCCGTAGRVEAWLAASIALDRPDLAARAHAAAAGMRALEGNRVREDADPRFLKGLAGAGWTLLRLHDPSLPCLLIGA